MRAIDLFDSNIEHDTVIHINTDDKEIEVVAIKRYLHVLVLEPAVELTNADEARDLMYAAQQRIDELQDEITELNETLRQALAALGDDE